MKLCSKFLLLIPALLFCTCIEPFEPDAGNYEKLLVVEGHISDRNEPYSIQLSQTLPLQGEGLLPETGAVVEVVDTEGARHLFEEITPGVYKSDPSCFVGIPGETYQLTVTRPNGASYRSDPVVLKTTPPIDSVHYKIDRRVEALDTVIHEGIKILVDSHDPQNATNYYRYEWTETYEIRVPYPEGIAVSVCYNTRTNSRILTTTSQSLLEDRISEFELKYITSESYELRNLYTIRVKQFALDEQAFSYWSQLQKLSETLGSLFDPQPYSVTGNLRNQEDDNEIVLGYFDASTISEERIFISRADLFELNYPDQGCYWNLVTVKFPTPAPVGYCLATQGPYGSGENTYAPPECCNCTLYGTLQKPDFWPR